MIRTPKESVNILRDIINFCFGLKSDHPEIDSSKAEKWTLTYLSKYDMAYHPLPITQLKQFPGTVVYVGIIFPREDDARISSGFPL